MMMDANGVASAVANGELVLAENALVVPQGLPSAQAPEGLVPAVASPHPPPALPPPGPMALESDVAIGAAVPTGEEQIVIRRRFGAGTFY